MGCCASKGDDESRVVAEERMIVFFEGAITAAPEKQLEAEEGVGEASRSGLSRHPEMESYAYFAQCAPRHKLCDVAAVACQGAVSMKDVEFYSIKASCESGQVKIMAGQDAEHKSIAMFTDKSAFPSLCFRVHMKQTEAMQTGSEGRRVVIPTSKQVGLGPNPPTDDDPQDGPGVAARA